MSKLPNLIHSPAILANLLAVLAHCVQCRSKAVLCIKLCILANADSWHCIREAMTLVWHNVLRQLSLTCHFSVSTWSFAGLRSCGTCPSQRARCYQRPGWILWGTWRLGNSCLGKVSEGSYRCAKGPAISCSQTAKSSFELVHRYNWQMKMVYLYILDAFLARQLTWYATTCNCREVPNLWG